MRRRQPQVAVPERLARFVPAEWGPGDVWAAFAAWKQARREWAATHYPHGGITPIGDGIDRLCFERDVRRRLPPQPPRPAEHWTDGPPPGWTD
jgi:hypothetical protein